MKSIVNPSNDVDTHLEWLVNAADHGHSSQQYQLASFINATSKDINKLVEVYKWLFLATLLGEQGAKEAALFIRAGMTQVQIDKSDELSTEWIQTKAANKNDSSNWSDSLKNIVAEM